MVEFIKWFWVSFNFKKWTFEGRELAKPHFIIWRLVFIGPLFFSRFLVAFFAMIYSLDIAEFKNTWDNN